MATITSQRIFWVLFWLLIKHKNVKTHRQFMVRSYTAALAFVFIRLFPVFGYKKVFPFLDTTMDIRITAEWLCWVIPFLIIETYMVWWPSLKKRVIEAPSLIKNRIKIYCQ